MLPSSDNRKPNRQSTVKPVGNTVDISNASYTNSIGDAELAVVWQDPHFNADELAFYYVRVLEIPTPTLDRLRREIFFRKKYSTSNTHGNPRARLYLADLVYAN